MKTAAGKCLATCSDSSVGLWRMVWVMYSYSIVHSIQKQPDYCMRMKNSADSSMSNFALRLSFMSGENK